MKLVRTLLPVVIWTGIAGGCDDSTAPVPTTPSLDGPHIYVANLTGQDSRWLARGVSPAWSPDGSRIAFDHHDAEGKSLGIFVVNADGGESTRISSGEASRPRWSPDASRVAFVMCIPSSVNGPFPTCDPAVGTINIDGSGETVLTRTDLSGTSPRPEWSPDGTRLAFVARTGIGVDLHVINADGSGTAQLTQIGTVETGADWSPDGRILAFGAAGGVHVINADGSNLTRLTDDGDSLVVRSVVFSPQGDRIAYSLSPYVWEGSPPPGSLRTRVVNADGTGEVTVATNAADPRWLPDGHTLSFYRGDNIWTVSADGGTPSLLLPGAIEAWWSPDGTRLAYVKQH